MQAHRIILWSCLFCPVLAGCVLTECESAKRVFGQVRADWEIATGQEVVGDVRVVHGTTSRLEAAAEIPLSAVADALMLPIAIPVALSRRQHEAKAASCLHGDDDSIRKALLKEIPVGTPVPKAIAFLESIGFRQHCRFITTFHNLVVDELSRSHERWEITVSLFKKDNVITDLKVARKERVAPQHNEANTGGNR